GVPQPLAVVATLGGRQRRRTGGTGGFLVISQEHELSQAQRQATDRLVREMGDRLPDATIAQCVSAVLDELSDARVKTYVPVLTYRLARERLEQLLVTTN